MHIHALLAEISLDELHGAIDQPLRAPRSFAHLVLGRWRGRPSMRFSSRAPPLSWGR